MSVDAKKRQSIKSLIAQGPSEESVVVMGWLRSLRKSKKFSFFVLNDGSCHQDLQIVGDMSLENYDELTSQLSGAAVAFKGKIVASGGRGQTIEMHAQDAQVLGPVDETYPLQKKATSLEFLRENAHLRARTRTFAAVFRLRHELAMATHQFFSQRDFYYLNSPIITGVDAEGAGEMFSVSTLRPDQMKKNDRGEWDYSKDYFGKETSLCVTGQLEAEAHCLGLGKVYTFGPTFRSENSNTPRHLAEFWMIEPEVAFADLEEIADLGSDYIKALISHALEHCRDEVEFLASRVDNGQEKKSQDNQGASHLETLEHVRDADFIKISYTEALDILTKSKKKFDFPVEWGAELQTEHERYLAEEYFELPVIVTDYPKEIKAFYMKQNDDGKTVRAMDILVPGVGELIGGSQREESLARLQSRMKELEMSEDPLWWYLDLRRFGSAPHAGFGLGFERAIMYISGMNNIRDVIAFPRTPQNCDF